jgi:hypothetical protein
MTNLKTGPSRAAKILFILGREGLNPKTIKVRHPHQCDYKQQFRKVEVSHLYWTLWNSLAKQSPMRDFLSSMHDNKYKNDDMLDAGNAETNDDDRNENNTLRQVGGAAVVGGIIGLCLVGPLVGVVAAGGAAALATSKGVGGDVARSTGDVASNAGDRLQDLNKKHRIVERSSNGFIKGCRWVSNKLKEKPATTP